jgi:hypothetical protein
LAGALDPGDVVPADRGFGSFYELALWQSGGVDAVVRMHQARRADFRTGRRLGARDHVVVWSRPDRPEWVDNALFRTLPRRLEVREVAVRVTQPGFRTRRLVVVTTLRDTAAYLSGQVGFNEGVTDILASLAATCSNEIENPALAGNACGL